MSDDGERGVPGKGLINGLAVTLKTMTKRSITQQYPDVEPELPPRSRGVIALLEENCTVCMLCARECPDWCIYIDSHKEEVVVPGAARARQRNVLDRFDIDFSLCMYCGICIEVCPFDALHWTPEFEYSELDVLDLLHDKNRLGDWMRTVPPPPAHDVLGEPSKEEATAARKAAGPGAATAAKTASVRRTPATTAPRATPGSRPRGAVPPAAAAAGATTSTPPPNHEPAEPGAESRAPGAHDSPGGAPEPANPTADRHHPGTKRPAPRAGSPGSAAEPSVPAAEPAGPGVEPARSAAESAGSAAEPSVPAAEPAGPGAEPARSAAEPAGPGAEPSAAAAESAGPAAGSAGSDAGSAGADAAATRSDSDVPPEPGR